MTGATKRKPQASCSVFLLPACEAVPQIRLQWLKKWERIYIEMIMILILVKQTTAALAMP